MAPPLTHLYFSPHLDDVALSCAGVIANHRARGARMVVATFFTGESDDALPALARHFHEAWQLGARPFAARCSEDLEAIRVLGATHRHEGMLDAVYRRKADGTALYGTIRDLFGPLRPEDDAIVEELANRMRALITEFNPGYIHLPLGVGRHVDHTAVAKAGRQAARGFADRVRIYEEFPYATGAFPRVQPDTVEAAVAASEWAPLSPVIEAVDLDQRIAAARCYRSQIDPLFGSDAAMCALQREYVFKIGGTAPAERYWVPIARA